MKKIFTLFAMAAMAIGANAQKITFNADEGKLASWDIDGFKLTYVDDKGKIAVDANNCYFGTAEEYVKYEGRLKTGGKSGAANNITLTVPSAGTLKVSVRTGSNSATDRNLVLTQGDETLYDQVVQESDAVTVTMGEKDNKVYPVIEVPVKAGDISVGYPTGSLNFYAFEFVAGGDPTTTVPQPIELTLDPGTDIGKAVAAAMETNPSPTSVKLILGAGSYTTTAPIVAGCDVEVSGVDAEIDASGLSEAFIKLADLSEEEIGKKIIINLNGISVSGLPYQLVYANKQNYLLNVSVSNCIIGINGAAKKATFDCNGGGNIAHLIIDGSTIYANPTVDTNGGFFTSQSSKAVIELDESATESKEITNSTLYNITYNRTVNTLRKNSQEYQSYDVKNCIIVNCGKKGQFLKGLNAGQAGKTGNWNVDGNIFNFDGGDISTDELVVDGVTLNNIPGVVTFSNPETGDFNYNVKVSEGVTVPASIGDPRWRQTVTTGINEVKTAAESNDVWYNLQGVRVDQPVKGVYVSKGKKVIVK